MSGGGIVVRWGYCTGCDHNRWLILDGNVWAGCRSSFEAAQAFADRLEAQP